MPINSVYNWVKNSHLRLFPASCVLCRQNTGGPDNLCRPCLDDLPYTDFFCLICSNPLFYNGYCGQCLRERPKFDRVLSVCRYASPVDFLVHSLKYRRKMAFASVLADLIKAKIQKSIADPDDFPQVLIPVPLHRKRFRERGFNQAFELSKPLGKFFNLPVDSRSCLRIRDTVAFSTISAKERQKNIKGAFKVERKVADHVAIIDDVMTTGATVSELSKALRSVGVSKIDVWVCAR